MATFYVYETTEADQLSAESATRIGVDYSGIGHVVGSKPVDVSYKELLATVPLFQRPFYGTALVLFGVLAVVPAMTTLSLAMVGAVLKSLTMKGSDREIFRQAWSAGVDAFETNLYMGSSVVFQRPIKQAYLDRRPAVRRIVGGDVSQSFSGVEAVDRGFEIEEKDGATSFVYRQNMPGPTLWITWGLLSLVPYLGYLFAPLLALQVLISLLKLFSTKKIVLTEDVIMGEGRRLAIKDVRTIYIYNWIEKRVADSENFAAKMNSGVVYQAGSWGASAQASQQLSRMIGRLLFEKPFEAIAYRICVDYGRKRIVLARGLRHDKAESLLADVLNGLRARGW